MFCMLKKNTLGQVTKYKLWQSLRIKCKKEKKILTERFDRRFLDPRRNMMSVGWTLKTHMSLQVKAKRRSTEVLTLKVTESVLNYMMFPSDRRRLLLPPELTTSATQRTS